MQREPHDCRDQSQGKRIANDGEEQSAGALTNGFLEPKFEAPLEEDKDQRQHAQNADHVVEVGGIYSFQYRPQPHTNQQENDNVRDTGPTRKAVCCHGGDW